MMGLLAPTPDVAALRGVRLLTIPTVARRLRVPPSTVVDLLLSGALAGVHLDGRLFVPADALSALRWEIVLRQHDPAGAA